MRRSNKMPSDFAQRISDGMQRYWRNRKAREAKEGRRPIKPSARSGTKFHEYFTPEPNTGCWLWTASLHRTGYGQTTIPGTGRKTGAHRVSWLLHFGIIPPGLSVLHRCDNRQCVNPAHLFLGDNQMNVEDRVRKGRSRSPKGEGSGRAKLGTAQVLAIRASTESYRQIAQAFGIGTTQVGRIKNRQCWFHL